LEDATNVSSVHDSPTAEGKWFSGIVRSNAKENARFSSRNSWNEAQMDISERRVIGALLLLLGVSLLAIGIYKGQLHELIEMLNKTFKTVI